MAEAALPASGTTGFRTIGQLAERCGHYSWLEHRLFALTGSWASAPAADGHVAAAADAEADGAASAPRQSRAVDAEVRVVCSAMSWWHGFAAAAWWDRLPVRAGVDPRALIVPPAGPIGAALDVLAAERDLLSAFDGLVRQVLPALLAAYDEESLHASAVSEAPVRALLDLVRPRVHQEIRRGSELLRRSGVGGGAGGSVPAEGSAEGPGEVAHVARRLQLALGLENAIFPAARAS